MGRVLSTEQESWPPSFPSSIRPWSCRVCRWLVLYATVHTALCRRCHSGRHIVITGSLCRQRLRDQWTLRTCFCLHVGGLHNPHVIGKLPLSPFSSFLSSIKSHIFWFYTRTWELTVSSKGLLLWHWQLSHASGGVDIGQWRHDMVMDTAGLPLTDS